MNEIVIVFNFSIWELVKMLSRKLIGKAYPLRITLPDPYELFNESEETSSKHLH
jgi:hypothetical protein